MTPTAPAARPKPWPALFRRWRNYGFLALPAVLIAGAAGWLGRGMEGEPLSFGAPYAIAWLAGSVGSLLVAMTLVWLMSRGSGFRLADLEPETGRALLLSVGALWIVAAVIGFINRDQPFEGAIWFAFWQMSYFNSLLGRRLAR